MYSILPDLASFSFRHLWQFNTHLLCGNWEVFQNSDEEILMGHRRDHFQGSSFALKKEVKNALNTLEIPLPMSVKHMKRN